MTSDSVGLSNPVWKCVSNECEGLNVGLSHNSKRRDPLFPPFQHITKMARVCDALKRQYARVNSTKRFRVRRLDRLRSSRTGSSIACYCCLKPNAND